MPFEDAHVGGLVSNQPQGRLLQNNPRALRTKKKMSFPKSEERKQCWSARDVYWQCLTDSGEDQSKCSKERTNFENSCVKQWVKYFDRRRDYLKYKEKIEKDGFDPVDNRGGKAKM